MNKPTTEQILSERGKTHGKYSEHARITQAIKELMRREESFDVLSDAQCETLEMIAHKIGRILAGNPDVNDHWDDIAGYATLASKDIDERNAPSDDEVRRRASAEQLLARSIPDPSMGKLPDGWTRTSELAGAGPFVDKPSADTGKFLKEHERLHDLLGK